MSLLLHERSESPSIVYHPLSRRSVTLLAPGKKPKHASASSSKSTPAPSTSGPSRSLKSYPVELQYGIVYNSDLESLRQNAMAERNGPHYFVAFMEEFLKSGVNGWQWVDDRDPAHYTGVFGHVAAPSTHPQYSLPALPALPGPSPREPSRRWLPALRYYTLVTSPEKDRKKLDNIRGRKSVIHYLYLCTDEGNKIDQMVLDTLDLNQLTHLCIQRTPGNRCDARSFLKSCHALRSYEVHVTRGFSELGASATPGLALQLSHITITGEKYTNILNLGYTFAAAPNLRTLQVLRPTTWQESHSWSWNKISGYAAEVARTETYLIGCAHLQYVEWGAWQSYAVTQYPAIMAAARGAVPGPGMFLDHIGAFNALTDLKIIMEPSWFSFSIPTLQRLQIGTGRPPYRTLGADQRHAPRQATPDYAPSNSLGDRVLLPGVFDHDDDDGFASWGEPDPNRSNAPWDAPPTPPDVRAAETTARQHHEVREQLIAALERIFLGCPHLQYLGIFLHRDALAIERDIETTTLLPLLHAHQAEHAGFHWDFIDFDEMTVTAPKFTFYTHNRGANGWKVAIVLKALGLTYEPKYLDFDTAEHKGPAYIALNPNGRIPCLVDNETGFTLWESGAIITYLVEKFDPDHKISATTAEERYQQLQWLFFQTSGQGPYYGQLGWFKLFHPEKIPSAIERYEKEIERVISVLSIVLEKQEWLLGSKVTVADLAFFTWNDLAFGPILMPNHEELKQKYPAVWAWHQKMTALPYVQEALAERAVVMGAH